MSKKLTRSKLVKKLDAIFSQYIRLKDADEFGNATCFTCGKIEFWKKGIQCGHFMSRKHYSTRWDFENCKPQCVSCNIYNAGRQFVFGKYLDEIYGDGKSDELYIKSKETIKIADYELEQMILKYKDLVDSF